MRLLAIVVLVVVSTTATVQAQQLGCPIDLAFLLDTSGSICDAISSSNPRTSDGCQNWERMKEFIVTFVEGIQIGTGSKEAKVALVTFGSSARMEWDLGRYTKRSDLVNAIRGIKYVPQQQTHMADALAVARDQVFNSSEDRRDSPNAVVLLTDGRPYDARQMERVLPEAESLKGVTNAKVFVVGVQTKDLNETILSMISSSPHEKNKNYFMSTGFNDLPLVASIKSELSRSVCEITTTTPPTTTTTTAPQVQCPVDIALLLDRSGSICEDKNVQSCQSWTEAKQFLVNLVDGMEIGNGAREARVALIIFDSSATLRWNLDRYLNKDDLKNAISNLEYKPRQTTQTHQALNLMMLEVFGKTVNERPSNVAHGRAAIIFTDGVPTKYDETLTAARAAAAGGVAIFTVGIAEKRDAEKLQQISSSPHKLDQNYFLAPDFANVGKLVNQVRTGTCGVELRTTVTATAPPTTVTGTAPPTVQCPIDLVFLLDRSGSICENNDVPSCQSWTHAKQFLARMVDGMQIGSGPNAARVAVITFGSQAVLEWNLDDNQNKRTLIDRIENLTFKAMKETYTHDALSLMIREVFGSQYKSGLQTTQISTRSQVAVILTDGRPTKYQETIDAARRADAAKIKVFVIGVTKSVSEQTLRTLSSPPQKLNENYFISDDFSVVGNLVSSVVKGACEPGPIVLPPRADCVIEFAFIVDVSAAVCGNQGLSNCQNWERMKEFMANLVRLMRIGPLDTRVALVTFGNSARIQWNLNEHLNLESQLGAMKNLTYNPNERATPANAMILTRNSVFNRTNVRPNARKIALLLMIAKPLDGNQRENCYPEALRMKGASIALLPLGITYSVGEYSLKIMSAGSRVLDKDFFRIQGFSQLIDLIPNVARSPAMSPVGCVSVIVN